MTITKNQEKIIFILAGAIIVFMLCVNLMLKRAIESSAETTTAEAPSATKKIMSPAQEGAHGQATVLPAEVQSIHEAVLSSKPQKAKNNEDKKIIYEPSIKDNVLLQ